MSEDEAKAAERRAAHRAQLRAALPQGYQPPPPSPFASARQWKWQDSFTPQGLAAAGGEGARFFGSKVFEPMARGARQTFAAAQDSFNEWNANREARDMRERDLAARYMPQIRAANARTEAVMAREGALRAREDALAGDYERSNAFHRERLDDTLYPWKYFEPRAYPRIEGQGRSLPAPGAPYAAPESMTDEEILAELRGRE